MMNLDKLLLGLIGFSLLVTFMLMAKGCADLNVETQQTSRVNSSATRNPVTTNSDSQGSTREQGKSPKCRMDSTGFNPNGKEN